MNVSHVPKWIVGSNRTAARTRCSSLELKNRVAIEMDPALSPKTVTYRSDQMDAFIITKRGGDTFVLSPPKAAILCWSHSNAVN